MKKLLLVITLSVISLFSIAQPATNFTVNDCSGTQHDLFSELNSGKVIVLCWVMPCGGCISTSKTTYNVVQSYQSSNPGRVLFYLADDFADNTCASLSTWASNNTLTNAVKFSDASIRMTDYGSVGMPKVVVLGGTNHTVFYNANVNVVPASLQSAISSALAATGISEQSNSLSSLTIFPNPAMNKAEIKFKLSRPSVISIELYNLQGQLMQNLFSGRVSEGENRKELNLSGYAPGMYLVKISDGYKSRFMNLVVSH